MLPFDPSAELAAPAIAGFAEAFPEPVPTACWHEPYALPSCWPTFPLEIVDFLPPAQPDETDPFSPTAEIDPITGWDGSFHGSAAGHDQDAWTELGDSLDINHTEEKQDPAGEFADENQVFDPATEEVAYVDTSEATDETPDHSWSPGGDWQELHDQEAHDPIGNEPSSDIPNPEDFSNDDYLIHETAWETDWPQREYALIIHQAVITELYCTYFIDPYHENQFEYDLEFAESNWDPSIDDDSSHHTGPWLDSPEWEMTESLDEAASPVDSSIDESAPIDDITAEQSDASADPLPDPAATVESIPLHWLESFFIPQVYSYSYSGGIIFQQPDYDPGLNLPERPHPAPHYRALGLPALASTSGPNSENTLAEHSSAISTINADDSPWLSEPGTTISPATSVPASMEVGSPHSEPHIREAIGTVPLMPVPLPVDFIPLSSSQTATTPQDSEPPTTASTPQETAASEPPEQTPSSDLIGTEVGVRDDASLALLDPSNPLHQPLLLGRI